MLTALIMRWLNLIINYKIINVMRLNVVCRESKAGKNGLSPLELSIIISGERKVITLERRCKASLFNPKTQKVRGDKELNEYISAVISKCWNVHNDMMNEGMNITLASFLYVYRNGLKKNTITITQAFNEVIATKTNLTTFNKYQVTLRYFLEFVGDIPLSDITVNTCNKFFVYLCERMTNNTAIQKMKQLNSVMLYSRDEGYITINPCKVKMKVDKLEYHPLTVKQLQQIVNKEIANERLSRVRDLFVFQCYTGLAYTDLMTLTKDNIIDNMIVKQRNKTKIKSVIPILDVTQRLLNKYDYQLPVLSNQKYNAYLKELGDICGITQDLHSHLARHTCATIFLNNGCSMHTVAKVLGHSSTKITESTYAELLPTTIQQQVLQLNNVL